ncbi:MAG: patatin-like phospholipase family protein [Moorea sp. SIOASIH]|uniref:patatin-like phospholipase family protein n=1 Tax=Moorena sp. SIOASIH TaxID=2607817 RepID=UPI0013B798B2|nr:patatin-like phospholipase family protein [Moorena sp. SIOASIH]NEO41252.1 patatin-like phospholipase family protein [Moorena sp. SIOASIH]
MSSQNDQNEEKKKFKILALDGGGIRGVVTARILEEVQEILGEDQPLNKYFDLIAGTSTGAIIAAGLAIGKTPKELREVYEDRGREIFHASWLRKVISFFFGSKYSNKGLIKVLREELKPKGKNEEITWRKVSEISKAELLILAYDTFSRNTTFFNSLTSKFEPKRWFNDMKLWEICTSSASAPTFFPPYEFRWGDWKFPHVDGGVGANCPEMAALAHAMLRGARIENISILSIGTGRTTTPFKYKAMKYWGIFDWGSLGWARRIADVFMGSQAQITTTTCQQIFKAINSDAYLRLQFDINERFEERSSEDEPRKFLDTEDQKNKFLHQKINEEMDDASTKNIKKLLDAAKKFADTKKVDIGKFIEKNQEHQENQETQETNKVPATASLA